MLVRDENPNFSAVFSLDSNLSIADLNRHGKAEECSLIFTIFDHNLENTMTMDP